MFNKENDSVRGEKTTIARFRRPDDDDDECEYSPSPISAVIPFIRRLQEYDAMRIHLEQSGGDRSDVSKIAALLGKPIIVRERFGPFKGYNVTLTNHASIHAMLNDIEDSTIHFDVRQLDTGFPVYYLCRIHKDYWAEYSLIVDDLHMSPGYLMKDERFIKLMYFGHEIYYLRLAHFRTAVANLLLKNNRGLADEKSADAPYGFLACTDECSLHALSDENEPSQKEVDEMLYNVGRHVFQAAWHEDQQLGVLVAIHFGLETFRNCIELLYLCLSGELCELRNAVNEDMLAFFDEVYPQPAILNFLNTLIRLDGEALTVIPRKALTLFERLSAAFTHFLGTEVEWAQHRVRIPLYKVVYGNFFRLDIVEEKLRDDARVRTEAACLESEARAITHEVLSHCS